LPVRLRHHRLVVGVSALRLAARDEGIRAQAEALAGSGSSAAACALVMAAAEDLEGEAPSEAALLVAEASWYALHAHGPRRALELARRAARLVGDGERDVALIVHARLGDALQWNGRYAEAQQEWLRAAASTPTSRVPVVLCARTDALLRAGELALARESAYAAAVRARDMGDAAALRDALTFQALSEIHLGLLREAHGSAREVEVAAGPAISGDRVDALGLLAWVEALLGAESSCRSRIAAAHAGAAELRFTPVAGLAAGLLALALGRYDKAVDHLEERLSGQPPLATMLSLRPVLDALVEACMRSKRHRRAEELVDDVFEAALATAQPRYAALAHRMRALTAGDPEGFQSALEQHHAWGNRFEEARTRLLYGESLRRAKRRAEAREQLSAATSSFATVGAKLWERRARDELRAAGARLPRTASGAALTAQEQRIASLVTEGLSNKEIAARLVLSTKTVEGHLRNAFQKLGVTSRTQLTRAMRL
jgi:DNA-binding CsgD family transcriptional regulator